MNNYITPIIVLVISAAIFFFYINPTWTGSIANTGSQIASYDSALASANQYQSKEAELLQDKNAIASTDLDHLSDFLPDGVNNVQIILDLDSLAARTGVVLSNFNIDDQAVAAASTQDASAAAGGALPLAESPVDSIDLSLTATANYASFRNFLSGVEHSLRILDVKTLSIAPSATGIYSYQLTLRLYWLH